MTWLLSTGPVTTVNTPGAGMGFVLLVVLLVVLGSGGKGK
jgi:hypothetical protein